MGKVWKALFQPSIRNLFLVRGFARPAGRARYFPSLESTQRVPQAAFSPEANTQVAKRLGFRKAKANLGRPRGACVVAAPGPPVTKEQCAASLARARPASLTSVPGRAAVAYGAVDPSPGSWTPVDPWSGGKGLLRQEYLAAVRAAVKMPCKVRARLGPRLVAAPGPNRRAHPPRLLRSSNKRKYPLRYKGGPGDTPGRLKGV